MGRLFGGCLGLVMVMAVAVVSLLSADVGVASATTIPSSPRAVALRSDLPDLTPGKVEADLQIQQQGSRVDIVEQLSESLGDEYAGVWFDNEAGEFVVPVVPARTDKAAISAAAGTVGEEFRSAALRDDYRTEVVESSHEELVAAQTRLNEQLAPYFESASIETALDAETNAVEIRVPEGMDAAALAAVERIGRGSKVEVEIVQVPPKALEVGPSACNEAERKCELPVRGGEVMYGGPSWLGPNGENLSEICTVGFRANGNDGRKYLLTAGHCAKRNAEPGAETLWTWMTQYSGTNYNIGTTSQFHYPGKDWAKIDATGTEADVSPWPTELAYWGANQEYPVVGEATSYKGQTLCHVGMNSGVSCGIVHAENVSAEYANGAHMNSMFEVTGAALALAGGDSGGPVVAGNVALGLVSGGYFGNDHATVLFSGITAADAELNVNVAGPGAPEAITGAAENVQATQATIRGQVNPRGLSCNYTIEYGQGTYSNSSSVASAGSGQGFSNVSTTLTGLQPLGRYQYRIKATNAYGTAYGKEGTFTTPAAKQIAVIPTKTSWSGVMWSATDGNVYETDAPSGEWESWAPTWSHSGIPAGVRPVSGPSLTPGASGWGGGIAWTGSDGNIYVTQAPSGKWESWSPTWSRSGIPAGVSVASQPTISPSGSSWSGFLWVGSDGNIYWTRAEANGTWTSFSPTWSHKGIPAGVQPVGRPVVIAAGGGVGGIPLDRVRRESLRHPGTGRRMGNLVPDLVSQRDSGGRQGGEHPGSVEGRQWQLGRRHVDRFRRERL